MWTWTLNATIFFIVSLEERGPFIGTNNWILSIERCFFPDICTYVWFKLAICYWKRRILKDVDFHYIGIIFPLRRIWPFIWINLHPLNPRMLALYWISGSGNACKVYRQTDIGWSEKPTWAFSSGELKSCQHWCPPIDHLKSI